MRLVPSQRLMFWVGAALLPAAAVGSFVPAAAAGAAILATGLGLLALLDAWRGRKLLGQVEFDLPATVRLTKDREGLIPVRMRHPAAQPLPLRLGLALPGPFQSPTADLHLRLPTGQNWARLDWRCTGTRRGRYPLPSIHLETASPLGFWHWRAAAPLRTELRVYPNLLTERQSVAALFLNRGSGGVHAQRQVGKGREFEKLRDYVPGDDYQDIHWKATARRGHPITKVFQIERTQEVYVIVDTSRLSARRPAAGDDSVLERFVTAALVLGVAAAKQGDLFGLVTFSDRVERFVRARNGAAHYNACRDALYTVQPQLAAPDFGELCSFLRLRLRRRALLVMLTSLDDPLVAESFQRDVALISRQHLVLVNMLQPPGVAPLFSGPPPATNDAVYERLGGHVLWHDLRELDKMLQRRGISFGLLQNERLCASLLAQYFNIKRRQLL